MPNHRWEQKHRDFSVRLVRESLSKQASTEFCRFLSFSQNPQTSFRTAHGGKNGGASLRAASRRMAWENLENRPENGLKISRKLRIFRIFRDFRSGISGFSGKSGPESPGFPDFPEFPGQALRERPSKANSSPCAYCQGAKHVRALARPRSARP